MFTSHHAHSESSQSNPVKKRRFVRVSAFGYEFVMRKPFYWPPNMLPNGIPPGIPPGNPLPLPGGGPEPAPDPNFVDSLSMTRLTLGLFSYFEMFSGFWLTSWKAAITSGS